MSLDLTGSSCIVTELVSSSGGFLQGSIVANGSGTVTPPAVDLARVLNINTQTIGAFSIDVTLNSGDSFSLATFGNTINVTQQKCESYITSIQINDLSGNPRNYIVNWLSLNENTND